MLRTSQAADPNPFGDFLPAWMQAGSAPATATTVAPISAQAVAAPRLDFSIEDLLRATDVATTAAQLPASSAPLPPPPFATATSTVDDLLGARSAPAAPPALPLPTFQEPPLWGRAAPTQPHYGVRSDAPPPSYSDYNQMNQAGFPPPYAPLRSDGPPFSIGDGFYQYTARNGQQVVHKLGSQAARFGGALLDLIFTVLFVVVLDIVLVFVFVGSTPRGSSSRNQNATIAIILISLISILLPTLYHILSVALFSRTLGHLIAGVKVVKEAGRKVGLISALLRAGYGQIPSLVY